VQLNSLAAPLAYFCLPAKRKQKLREVFVALREIDAALLFMIRDGEGVSGAQSGEDASHFLRHFNYSISNNDRNSNSGNNEAVLSNLGRLAFPSGGAETGTAAEALTGTAAEALTGTAAEALARFERVAELIRSAYDAARDLDTDPEGPKRCVMVMEGVMCVQWC
jgi:hypothetical protein